MRLLWWRKPKRSARRFTREDFTEFHEVFAGFTETQQQDFLAQLAKFGLDHIPTYDEYYAPFRTFTEYPREERT